MNLANRSIMVMGAPPYKKLDSVAAADAFSELSTYEVGDCVSYKARTYKCTVPVSTPGTWTGSTNWEEFILADEIVEAQSQTRLVEYRLPDDCFPITYEDSTLPSGQQSCTIASNDGIRFEFNSINNIVILHDISSEAAGGYDYGFSIFLASTLKWSSKDAPIANLKFNNTAPTENTWPVLEKDAVFVRDVQVAKDADVLKNSGDQELDGNLQVGNTPLEHIELRKDTATVVAEYVKNNYSQYKHYIPSGTKDDTLSLLSDIYAAVQQIAPAWVSGTPYAADAKVSYNGVVYARKTSGYITSSTNPASDTTNWQAKEVSELFLPLTGGNLTGSLHLDGHYVEIQVGNGGVDNQHARLSREELQVSDGAESNTKLAQYGYNTIWVTANGSTYTLTLPYATGTLALLQNLAPNFSTSATYAVGQLCVYGNALYRCTTAIGTAEAWTAAHWTEATVDDVLAAIRSALDDKAPLASPVFTGTPTAPTASEGTSSTQIATTEFVATALTGKVDVGDFNDQSLIIAQNTENIAENTNQITALGNSKLDATVGAPAFSTLSTYPLNEYVTNGGQLYRCTTAITATGEWDPSKWEVTDMTSPDATLDITATGLLRVVSADGEVLWHQGYNLGTSNSLTLSSDTVNSYTYSVNATGETSFTLPTPANGKVGDFVLDVTNPPLSSTAADFPPTFSTSSTYASGAVVYYNSDLWECVTAVSTAGAWTGTTNWQKAYPSMTISQYESKGVNLVIPKGDNIGDMFSFAPSSNCELYFTLTAFALSGKPTWKVVRQDVEVVV